MLDEEKIKLMTQITIYEKTEEFGELALSKYYKEDFVKFGCLKTLVSTTFCYWLCVAVYILLNFESILENLSEMDYFKTISTLMMGYVAAMVVFYIYAFIVYNYKYSKAKPKLVRYNRFLRKLINLYEADEIKNQKKKGKIKVYSSIGGDEDMEESSERGSRK